MAVTVITINQLELRGSGWVSPPLINLFFSCQIVIQLFKLKTPGANWKRMKRAKKQPPTPDQAPPTVLDMVDNTMMDMLLDMLSWMQAMEEYVAQQNTINHMVNQGLFWIRAQTMVGLMTAPPLAAPGLLLAM